VALEHPGEGGVAFFVHVELRDTHQPDDGEQRVLPAFYSRNFISMIPGEAAAVEIQMGAASTWRHGGCHPGWQVVIGGWNVASLVAPVSCG